MEFKIDISNIKIAGSEESISKTIEELLALNKRIPKRHNEEIMDVTEKQLDTRDYPGKKDSEVTELTEKQFGKRVNDPVTADEIIEIKIENAEPSKGGNNPDAWDKDDEKMRGHKNIPPLWLQVLKHEEKVKQMNTGQLDKKK